MRKTISENVKYGLDQQTEGRSDFLNAVVLVSIDIIKETKNGLSIQGKGHDGSKVVVTMSKDVAGKLDSWLYIHPTFLSTP